MSLVLDTGAMKYRENPNQPWRPLVIKAGMNWESMADTYDPDNGTYEVGQYVLEDGMMYRCIHPIDTPEAWTPAHWIEINIGDELFSLQGSIASEATTRASEDAAIRNTLNQLGTETDTVENSLAIIVEGNSSASGASQGQYVYLKDSTISGFADGLYTAAQAIPANTAIDGTYLTAIVGGGLNSLANSFGVLLYEDTGIVTYISGSTINVNLSGYKYIDIVFSYSNTDTYYSSVTIPVIVGKTVCLSAAIASDDTAYYAIRNVTINSLAQIEMGQGRSYIASTSGNAFNNAANDACIIRRIYGYK